MAEYTSFIYARSNQHKQDWKRMNIRVESEEDAKRQIDNASDILKRNLEFAVKTVKFETYP